MEKDFTSRSHLHLIWTRRKHSRKEGIQKEERTEDRREAFWFSFQKHIDTKRKGGQRKIKINSKAFGGRGALAWKGPKGTKSCWLRVGWGWTWKLHWAACRWRCWVFSKLFYFCAQPQARLAFKHAPEFREKKRLRLSNKQHAYRKAISIKGKAALEFGAVHLKNLMLKIRISMLLVMTLNEHT